MSSANQFNSIQSEDRKQNNKWREPLRAVCLFCSGVHVVGEKHECAEIKKRKLFPFIIERLFDENKTCDGCMTLYSDSVEKCTHGNCQIGKSAFTPTTSYKPLDLIPDEIFKEVGSMAAEILDIKFSAFSRGVFFFSDTKSDIYYKLKFTLEDITSGNFVIFYQNGLTRTSFEIDRIQRGWKHFITNKQ